MASNDASNDARRPLSSGTGKTEVSRLMAKILHDFKLRSSSEIRSTTGGNLLRDGADEFKKMLEQVDGGVLFIDEVYQLDPKNNKDGADIMNLLLTFAEDKRGECSVVLAGYRDEVETLLSFNPGLASRFPNT